MMTEGFTVNALVLRQASYKESDLILTLYSDTMGKLTVKARGARRKGSALMGSTQLLAYASFTVDEERGYYVIKEADPIDLMIGLRTDIERLSLAAYFAQLTETVTEEEEACPEILRLLLNTLYALGKLNKDLGTVKAAFELKLSGLTGFEPFVSSCALCGAPCDAGGFFDPDRGVLVCGECAQPGMTPVSPAVLQAMRHVVYGDPKRLFSFSLDAGAQKQLNDLSERFILTQLDCAFSTLEFYRSLGG